MLARTGSISCREFCLCDQSEAKQRNTNEVKKNEGRKWKISKYYKQLFTFPCLKTSAVQNESYMQIIAFKRELMAFIECVSICWGVQQWKRWPEICSISLDAAELQPHFTYTWQVNFFSQTDFGVCQTWWVEFWTWWVDYCSSKLLLVSSAAQSALPSELSVREGNSCTERLVALSGISFPNYFLLMRWFCSEGMLFWYLGLITLSGSSGIITDVSRRRIWSLLWSLTCFMCLWVRRASCCQCTSAISVWCLRCLGQGRG